MPANEPAAPRARWATPRTPGRLTYGPAVARVSEAFGQPFMPWQRQVADTALELLPDGRWAYTVIVVTVPRQAGKTTLVGCTHCHRGIARPGSKSWLTAQRRQAARDTWSDVAARVAKSPLASVVERRRSNGSESLTFPGGATFRVFAPSEDALHGSTNELVSVDECWAFDDAQGAGLEQAILPTFTVTGGQLWIISTAGTAASAWLRGYIDRGRIAADTAIAGADPERVAFFEWSLDVGAAQLVAEGLAAGALPELRARAFDIVEAHHPGAGHTLRRDALEQAAGTMEIGEFLRAYGNVWTSTSNDAIPVHIWNRQAVKVWPKPPLSTPVAFAFDVSLDRSRSAIVAAWRLSPGVPVRVDVVDARAGDDWVVDRLLELRRDRRPVGIGHDSSGPAADLADELRRRIALPENRGAGLVADLVATSTRDYLAACSGFLAALRNGALEHNAQADLDLAVAAAGTRIVGDGWAWSRRSSAASIAELVAATLARWTLDHAAPTQAAPIVVRRRHGTSV